MTKFKTKMPNQVQSSNFKIALIKEVNRSRHKIAYMSDAIFRFAELSGKERRSAAFLKKELRRAGFKVKAGVGGLPTAFTAESGRGKPKIALIAEYDALPKIGHACGHNIIAAAGTYAAIALHKSGMLKKFDGTVVVIGTPAEEAGGGKIKMLSAGVFRGIDAVLEVHPDRRSRAYYQMTASRMMQIQFFSKWNCLGLGSPRLRSGQAARHRYDKKITIIDALVDTAKIISDLGKKLAPRQAQILQVIKKGGETSNVFPSEAEIEVQVWARAPEQISSFLDKIKKRARKAARGAGVKVSFIFPEPIYLSFKPNRVLARLFEKNINFLGVKTEKRPFLDFDSTDLGNVSAFMPALHADLMIPEARGMSGHTAEFAALCGSAAGHRAAVLGAKALAMTALDLLITPKKLPICP